MKKWISGLCFIFLTTTFSASAFAADGGKAGLYLRAGTATDNNAADTSVSSLIYEAGYRLNDWFGLEYNTVAPRTYTAASGTQTDVIVSGFYAAFRYHFTPDFDLNYKWGKVAVTTKDRNSNTSDTSSYSSSGPGLEVFFGNVILFAEQLGYNSDGVTVWGLGYQF